MVTDDAEALPEAQFPQRHTSAFFLFLIYVFRGTGTSDRFIGIRVPSTFVATGPSLPRKTSLELSPQPLEEVVISLLSPEGARHGILHRDVDLHIGYPAFAEPGVRRVEKFGADPRAAPMDGDLRDAPV